MYTPCMFSQQEQNEILNTIFCSLFEIQCWFGFKTWLICKRNNIYVRCTIFINPHFFPRCAAYTRYIYAYLCTTVHFCCEIAAVQIKKQKKKKNKWKYPYELYIKCLFIFCQVLFVQALHRCTLATKNQ